MKFSQPCLRGGSLGPLLACNPELPKVVLLVCGYTDLAWACYGCELGGPKCIQFGALGLPTCFDETDLAGAVE